MTSKFLPAAMLAAMAALGGAVIATAQTTEPAAPTDGTTTTPAIEAPAAEAPVPTDAPVERTGFFGGRGHDHGGRGSSGGILRPVLAQADADSDGAVTQAEIDAVRASLVGGADASGEGDLSLEEFQTVYLELIRPQMVDAFQDLDEDGDAAVTAAELDASFGNMVAQMDRDGDGALSAADGGRGGDHDDGRGRRR